MISENTVEMIECKEIIIAKPRFMSNKRFLSYLAETFPKEWLLGWNDWKCKTFRLLIPTIKQDITD